MKEEGPSGRRRRSALTFGAAGLGLIAALSAIWWFRAPLASGWMRWQLASQGVDSDFRIERLDLAGAELAAIRLGPEGYPEATALRAELRFGWRPLPAIDFVRLIEPRLRVRVNEEGVSLGTLDEFFKVRRERRPELPRWVFEIVDGQAIFETPFGILPASAVSRGRIGSDFQGEVRFPSANRATRGGDRLRGAEGVLRVRSNAHGLFADLNLTTADFVRRRASGENVRLSGRLAAPNDLASAGLNLAWSAERLTVDDSGARGLHGTLKLQGALQETAWAFADWRASARSDALAIEAESVVLHTPRLESAFAGDANGGRGRWSIASRAARMKGWRAAGAAGSGEVVLEFGEKLALSTNGALTLQQAQLSSPARANLRRRWPQLGGTPFAVFMQTSAESLDRALRGFTLNAPVAFTLRNDEGLLSLTAPFEARSRSGAVARFRPLRSDAPMFGMKLGDGITNLSGVLEVGGGGLPITILTIDRFSRVRNEPTIIAGSFVAPGWRAQPAAELGAANLKTQLTISDGSVDLRVMGPLEISGPAGAADVRSLVAPLDLAVHWGRGFRVGSPDGRCMNVRFGRLSLPGVELANGETAICPLDGAFFTTDAQGRAAGGFAIANPSFSGHIAGEPAQRAQLGAQRVVGRFGGNGAGTTLDIAAEAPRMNVRFAEGRDIAVTGARLTAQSRSADGTWRTGGVFENGELRDPALPANVANISGRWAAEPQGDDAIIRILDATARLSDRPPQDTPADYRARFNPLLLTGVSADLVAGRLVGRGDIRLEHGERSLAAFEAEHDLKSASGQAHLRARNFAFSRDFQPFEISELLRGVIDMVEGRLDADADLHWSPDGLTGTGRLATTDLSLASATLPVVRGVAGEIVFSNIFTLTTPPAQRLSIRALNPGVEVRDGVMQFQLLGDGRVAIESATWPFAGGSVAVAPATVTLGSRETRLNLILRDIDVALLLQNLNAPDLTATGRVEGEFPLVLTPTAALVEQGTLRAAICGGTIAYVGRAREEATGVARIAFEALSSFRYDSLALELNGDLAGDVIAAIVFTGHNQEPLDVSSATPGAPIRVVGGAGIPFKFNVRITAPFRSLAQTAAGISDPGVHVRRALDPILTPHSEPTPPQEPTTVDPPVPSPR